MSKLEDNGKTGGYFGALLGNGGVHILKELLDGVGIKQKELIFLHVIFKGPMEDWIVASTIFV